MMKVLSLLFFALNTTFAFESDDLLKELSLSKSDVSIKLVKTVDSDTSKADLQTRIFLKRKADFRGNSLQPRTLLIHWKNRGLTHIVLANPKLLFKISGVVCQGDINFSNDKLCGCPLGEPLEAMPGLILPKGAAIAFHNNKLETFNLGSGEAIARDSSGRPVLEFGGVKLEKDKIYQIQNGKVRAVDLVPEGECGE